MKKIVYTFFTLTIGVLGYAQVIIGGNTSNMQRDEDLDINGNLKVEAVENLCKEVNGEVICDPYTETYMDTDRGNVIMKGNIPKIFQRLVFFVRVGNKDDKIVRFDTKINSKKYMAIVSGSAILDGNGNPFLLPQLGGGLNATRNIDLFEYSEDPDNTENSTWAFSADFTSDITSSPVWRIELLVMNRAFVATVNSSNPDAIYDVKNNNEARLVTEGGVGIKEEDPKANLDVKGEVRIGSVQDVTSNQELKNRTMPLVVDISEDANGNKSDSWGILKAAASSKMAYPFDLHINMLNDKKDFVYFMRLGLDPEKYTPMLANYQLKCTDTNNPNWGINFVGGKQPTPNNYITRWDKNGTKDWALYLDFDKGDPVGCNNTVWDAFLIVFKNENLIKVPVKDHQGNELTASNPVNISYGYDTVKKGYIGTIQDKPLP